MSKFYLIDREALGIGKAKREAFENPAYADGWNSAIEIVNNAPPVDAIPIDTVAEMLADLFGDECCCNYYDIDEWLPFVCEHSETCLDAIGKNGCWKQFIKHYDEFNKRWHERRKEHAAD